MSTRSDSRRRRLTPVLTRISLALAGLCLAAACSTPVPAADAQAAGRGRGGDAAVPVTTTHVVEKSVPLEVTTIGTAEAYSTVEVRSQVTGQLMTVEFTEGQDVEKGQLLFTIDPRPFEVAVRQAEATRDKDIAQANNAEALRAKNESLLKGGLLSQVDYDTAATSAAALKATVAADLATVDNAKLQLQYTKIVAPVGGRTGALLVHQGSLVRSSDVSPLVIINQLAPIRVVFAVPGQYLAAVRDGLARGPLNVLARASAGQGPESTGTVSFVDNAVDSPTGTIKLKAVFANTEHRLWPGDLTQTTLRLAVDPHAVVVPQAAVQNGQQGQYVYVVGSDHTVAVRAVTIQRTNGDDAVVGKGLQVGEEVVTDGQLRLVPGARVSVKAPSGGGGP